MYLGTSATMKENLEWSTDLLGTFPALCAYIGRVYLFKLIKRDYGHYRNDVTSIIINKSLIPKYTGCQAREFFAGHSRCAIRLFAHEMSIAVFDTFQTAIHASRPICPPFGCQLLLAAACNRPCFNLLLWHFSFSIIVLLPLSALEQVLIEDCWCGFPPVSFSSLLRKSMNCHRTPNQSLFTCHQTKSSRVARLLLYRLWQYVWKQ